MTTVAVGNRRLLKLAKILDTHKGAFDMNGCGSCAAAIWNDRSRSKADGFCNSTWGISFENDKHWWELFGNSGCDNAQTPKQAAKYIRAFVKRRQK